jgi:transposase InsO family protein
VKRYGEFHNGGCLPTFYELAPCCFCHSATAHKNAHTTTERDTIVQFFDANPTVGITEAWGRLRQEQVYGRTYLGFYHYVCKNELRPATTYEKYVPKDYDTPVMLGQKWQIDVKFVPYKNHRALRWAGIKLYQYTCIDEATRERFIFFYDEHSGWSTVNFICRAIAYFRYIPQEIQTDNGSEFRNAPNSKELHIVDQLLNALNIKHHFIRAYCARQNGKVERSHRIDQENFYKFLGEVMSRDELKDKGAVWLNRYNNIPKSCFKDENGKRTWQTPLEKRAELEKKPPTQTEFKLRAFTKADYQTMLDFFKSTPDPHKNNMWDNEKLA